MRARLQMLGSARTTALLAAVVLLVGLVVAQESRASNVLLNDGFESGDLSQWSAATGMRAQRDVVDVGSWAARATAAGNPAYAYTNLATSQIDLWVNLRFDVLSQAATNVSLLRLRTTAVAPVLTLYRRADGALLAYD
ncbi:MAG: hypothetical protein ACXVFV_02175, partial [Mycobacteriales bacterium]